MDLQHACMDTAFTYPLILFIGGSVVLAAYIKIHQNLTVLQTMLVMVGLRSSRRDWITNLLHAATILVPGMLWIYLYQRCLASLG